MEDANANDRRQTQNALKIGMRLASAYSDGRDMEKAISTHRWSLANCNRLEVSANYCIRLSHNFNRFKKFEYTIEVLEGSMDLIRRTFDQWAQSQAETLLIQAYTKFGEFLKAKAADKKRRSTDIQNFVAVGLQSGRIEEGMCLSLNS
mmetsp:Transcript_18258/g.27073  ORF Transcript_18258/g.27073 Transcript_18258/m.27073 type:complete len:148 (+) Transcript_18258:442-885(+)